MIGIHHGDSFFKVSWDFWLWIQKISADVTSYHFLALYDTCSLRILLCRWRYLFIVIAIIKQWLNNLRLFWWCLWRWFTRTFGIWLTFPLFLLSFLVSLFGGIIKNFGLVCFWFSQVCGHYLFVHWGDLLLRGHWRRRILRLLACLLCSVRIFHSQLIIIILDPFNWTMEVAHVYSRFSTFLIFGAMESNFKINNGDDF